MDANSEQAAVQSERIRSLNRASVTPAVAIAVAVEDGHNKEHSNSSATSSESSSGHSSVAAAHRSSSSKSGMQRHSAAPSVLQRQQRIVEMQRRVVALRKSDHASSADATSCSQAPARSRTERIERLYRLKDQLNATSLSSVSVDDTG